MDIEKLKAGFEQTECFKRLEHVAKYTFFEFGAYIKRTDVPADVEKKYGRFITALIFSWSAWKEAHQAVQEGFVLVPTKNVSFFSHDFNGDGFQYHDTLEDAKKTAEADLDIYRDRVADGNHIAEMGEFNELSYGIVMGQAEWSVDCVVSAEDHKNGEYTRYNIGTEILSLYLSEAQEPTND